MAFNHFKWREKQFKKEGKILKRALKRKLTDAEKLELLELSIYPYSRDGRFGMKKALKHAIKLLKNEQKSPLEEMEKKAISALKILWQIGKLTIEIDNGDDIDFESIAKVFDDKLLEGLCYDKRRI